MELCSQHRLLSYDFIKKAYEVNEIFIYLSQRFFVSLIKSSYFMQGSDWINKLFQSVYHATNGTDALIESPVAFAGYHVAKKRGILLL